MVIHPCVMFHFASHRTLNTRRSSLPPTSLVFLSSSSPKLNPLYTHLLWRSTAGWHFCGIRLFHRLCAPEDRAQRIFSSIHKKQNWRSGWYGGNRSNRCPTAIHSTYDFGLKTNNYLWCWLHQCIFRNERKMKDEQELITLNEKALLQGFSRDPEVSVKLLHCFHAKVSLFKTLEKGLLFYQTRSHAIVLNDTQPAVCMEKGECMKTKDEQTKRYAWLREYRGLYQKRTRNTVNKMYANDGSSTTPAQEVGHTLTDSLESAGQALYFSRICSRGFDGSLSRRLRGAGPCFLIPFCNSSAASKAGSGEEFASAIGGARAAPPG